MLNPDLRELLLQRTPEILPLPPQRHGIEEGTDVAPEFSTARCNYSLDIRPRRQQERLIEPSAIAERLERTLPRDDVRVELDHKGAHRRLFPEDMPSAQDLIVGRLGKVSIVEEVAIHGAVVQR